MISVSPSSLVQVIIPSCDRASKHVCLLGQDGTRKSIATSAGLDKKIPPANAWTNGKRMAEVGDLDWLANQFWSPLGNFDSRVVRWGWG